MQRFGATGAGQECRAGGAEVGGPEGHWGVVSGAGGFEVVQG